MPTGSALEYYVHMQNSYIRFLNTLDRLDRVNPAQVLDYIEIQLLNYVLSASLQNQSLQVGDLISLDQLGSQATLHGRLKNLTHLGYINLVPDKKDARKKSVLPTKLAMKYAQFMSHCLSKSVHA